MGVKKSRLKAFLAEHPMCCFCGGSTLATTQDHIPPRSVFHEKKWPEGYVFPACAACNNGASRDDALVAFLARMDPVRDFVGAEEAEWTRILAALKEHYPGIVKEMILSATGVRKWFKKNQLQKPDGVAYGEMPIIKIPEVAVEAVARFNGKLLRALHYKHSRKIVPSTAWIRTRWWTNANFAAGQFPRKVLDLLPGRAELQRSNVSLGEQFSYRYATGNNGTLGAYAAGFRNAFAVIAVVVFDASSMADKDDTVVESAMESSVQPAVGAAPATVA